eukprot:scaffold151064_cov45-Tisochrysis_lutea.AAC.1
MAEMNDSGGHTRRCCSCTSPRGSSSSTLAWSSPQSSPKEYMSCPPGRQLLSSLARVTSSPETDCGLGHTASPVSASAHSSPAGPSSLQLPRVPPQTARHSYRSLDPRGAARRWAWMPVRKGRLPVQLNRATASGSAGKASPNGPSEAVSERSCRGAIPRRASAPFYFSMGRSRRAAFKFYG